MPNPRVNSVILSSIPINRKVKRYWISKYERVARNCGPDEACRKFKQLRVAVLTYLSDPDRHIHSDKYWNMAGFRKNGMLRILFERADCQPHYVLSFLKLFSMQTKSTQSMEEAAGECKRRLEHVKANAAVPFFLREWVDLTLMTRKERLKRWQQLSSKSKRFRTCFSALVARGWTEFDYYFSSQQKRLRKGWTSAASQRSDEKLPFPEVYKDYSEDGSVSYELDIRDLMLMHEAGEDSPLSSEELAFVDGFLNEEVEADLYGLLWGNEEIHFRYSDVLSGAPVIAGQYVGHVQHIHKKGGGTELRDIAVPNRFIQLALAPAAKRLYSTLKELPHDATFDQDRFDRRIQNRVNNPNLYQGSVDLSKATDNLPSSWGEYIISHLEAKWPIQEEEHASIQLFWTVTRAKWEDEGYLLKWTVGQPLGSLPSFAVLGITHNCLVEALAARLNVLHSPYFILGDDIVLTNRKVRKAYITELNSRAIPLSLHKSYTGRLSEFAGKTFVKGCVPFYCSDHNPLTWESLFDWQRTTGIRIPWVNLPKAIRRRILRLTDLVLSEHSDLDLNFNKRLQVAESSYTLALSTNVFGRGSHIYPTDSVPENGLIEKYFEYIYSLDHVRPEGLKHSGITMIGAGHPVTMMSDKFADHDGFFCRFRPVELPQWYRDKVRPVATDAVLKAAIAALL